MAASVPITNVSNGDNDSITLSVLSKGNPSVTATVPFVLTAANYAFNMKKNFDNAKISPEKSAVYELQINNTDSSNDTYLLSTLDSNWTYIFRNAADTQNITSLYVPANMSQEFFVKVTVPLYGVSEGDAETATVKAVSIHKASVKDQVTVNTIVAGTFNTASFRAIKETMDSTVNMGRSFDYHIDIDNMSVSADMFHLSISGGSWNYGIRNQNDVSNIACLTVLGNSSRSFVVRVYVPLVNINSGDTDTITVKIESNNSGFASNKSITTTANQFYALSFATTDFISITHQNELNIDPMTVEVWINPISMSTTASENPIVSKLNSVYCRQYEP
ncbi:hypothetical protein MHK_000487 [Candidatus Magnetomorum sp. HK-1]|nr:hypothetical protein MHK_000487 [Candidatus Magnetomorum sp. HK-1]